MLDYANNEKPMKRESDVILEPVDFPFEYEDMLRLIREPTRLAIIEF